MLEGGGEEADDAGEGSAASAPAAPAGGWRAGSSAPMRTKNTRESRLVSSLTSSLHDSADLSTDRPRSRSTTRNGGSDKYPSQSHLCVCASRGGEGEGALTDLGLVLSSLLVER